MENINDTIPDSNDSSQEILEKASLGYRFGAFIVDHIILTSILVVPFIMILFRQMETEPTRVFAAFPLFMLVAYVVYSLRDIVNGQSFGKYLFGMAVRDSHYTSETPSIARLFIRNIFNFVWPIEFLVLAYSSSKTKLGDRLANTDVYRISKKPKLIMLVIPIILVVVLFVGSLFFGILSFFRNHPAYHMALDYIEDNPRITELVGEIESFGFFPSGNISTSGGHGQADFTIRVYGSDGTAHVRVILVREPLGGWEVVGFRYRK